MDNILVGDIVSWVISNKKRKGIFQKIQNGKAVVMCTECDGVPMAIKCFVDIDLIQAQEV